MHPLVRRLLSPAGFLLVAICFVLPFVTVSCESSGGDPPGVIAEGTYSGVDMVVGGAPDLTWQGLGRDDLPEDLQAQEDPEEPEPLDPQPLAILAAVAIALGVAAALLPTRWARTLAGLGCAAIGVVTLIGAELVLLSDIQHQINEGGLDEAGAGVEARVRPRFGFWLAALFLLGLAVANGLALLRTRAAPPVPGTGTFGESAEL